MKFYTPLFIALLATACVPGGGNGPDTVVKNSSNLSNSPKGEFKALDSGDDEKPVYCTNDSNERSVDKRLKPGQKFIYQDVELTSDGTLRDEGDIQTVYNSVNLEKNQFTRTVTYLDKEDFWFRMTCKVASENNTTTSTCEPDEYSPTITNLIVSSGNNTDTHTIYSTYCYIHTTKKANENIPEITADSTSDEIEAIMKAHEDNLKAIEDSLPKNQKGIYTFSDGKTVSAFKSVTQSSGDATCYVGDKEVEYKNVTSIETKVTSIDVPTLHGSSCGGEEPVYTYKEMLDENGKRISFEKFELKEINL